MIKKIIDTKKISFLTATLFGSGYFPIAPGTFASFVSLPVILFTCYYFGIFGLIVLIFTSFAAGMLSVKKVLQYSPHDPCFIVIDEFIGQAVTFLPAAEIFKHNMQSLWLLPAGFVLFRIFDVKKPFPVNYADKNIKNALGVILDDVFAGVYSAVLLYIFLILIKK